MPSISKEQLDEYNKLLESAQFEESIPTPTGLNFTEVQNKVTHQLKDTTPVTIPRNSLLLMAGGVATLVLLTWPVLIVSFLLGAATIIKVGCPCGLNLLNNKPGEPKQ